MTAEGEVLAALALDWFAYQEAVDMSLGSVALKKAVRVYPFSTPFMRNICLLCVLTIRSFKGSYASQAGAIVA